MIGVTKATSGMVNPARAGMILMGNTPSGVLAGKPRASGDDPASEEEGWSPWS